MPTFKYIAQETKGARVVGTLTGTSETAVLSKLEAQHLLPIEISVVNAKRSGSVGTRKLATAYTQLADLLGAGVPLMRSLEILTKQKSNPNLSPVLGEIARQVADGHDLAQAMEEHPRVFPPVHVAMVRAGEKGGFIEGVFQRLGELVEAQAELHDKVRGSLVYPAFVVGIGSVIISAIFFIFVPRFEKLIEQRLESTPAITEAVFAVGHLVTGYWWAFPLSIAGVVFLLRWAIRQPEWRARLARWRSRTPMIGSLSREIAVARFCRLLGTMESNGVPLLHAMGIARQAAGDPQLEAAIDDAIEAVSAGESIATPLAESGMFGDDVVEMISVGEASGNIDSVLLRMASTLEKRVSRRLDFAVELIGPSALLVLGVMIALIAVGLILPLTQLSSSA